MTIEEYWMSLQPGERLDIADLIIKEHGWVQDARHKYLDRAYDHAVTLSIDQLRAYLAFIKLEKLVGA